MTSRPSRPEQGIIRVRGASQNNLRGIDLDLRLGELTVITGVSGSGKSSLAFDTLYAEGQRRYVETFSPYARQFLDRMDRPRVDRIDGIPPAIAIDQTNPVRSSRSTVGTMTELNDHLKLLFARASSLFCRDCGERVESDSAEGIARILVDSAPAEDLGQRALVCFRLTVPESFSKQEVKSLLERQGYTRLHRQGKGWVEVVQDRLRLNMDNRGRLVEDLEAAFHFGTGRATINRLNDEGDVDETLAFSAGLHCARCDIDYSQPTPSAFSFNSPLGACETCRGFGRTIGVDYDLVIPDTSRSLADGAIRPIQSESYSEIQRALLRYAKKRGVPVDKPWRRLSAADRRWVIEGEGHWDERVWFGIKRFFAWLEGRSYRMHVRVLLSRYRAYSLCPDCAGARLKPDALLWRVGKQRQGRSKRLGLNLRELMLLPIERCTEFFAALELPAPLDEATELLLDEIRSRLRYLVEVGLGYLTLDRQSRTLSGGEVQRINLTTALGTSLVNTLFVLDEPSIGLHPRDIHRLNGILRRLRDAGNTLLVVEHDPQIMQAADRILDMGPGPGSAGGRLVFEGDLASLHRSSESITGAYLRGERQVSVQTDATRRGKPDRCLEILGASENNLQDIDVSIPLQRLVCVTGVSGSGKSTLIDTVLYRALHRGFGRPGDAPGLHRKLRGAGQIADVVLVNQSPIGKTTRSNPLSYVGALESVRKLFARQPLSGERGYKPGTFSFNSGNGRCPGCGGNGFEHVEMQFLSDVYLRCAECNGRRYRAEILEVKVPGRTARSRALSIADVLDLTVADALKFFRDQDDILRALQPLADVGLDYLTLGQPVPTLSGGEAQRLKLAGHLAKSTVRFVDKGKLFVFDEPTTGLHFDDIAKLLLVFTRLRDEGHSLLVIEHNLDVIAAADWVIDLGPEGGEGGGRLLFSGTPAQLRRSKLSHTGRELAAYHKGRGVIQQTVDSRVAPRAELPQSIRVHNAREHNLKNLDVVVPHQALTVITGISGSGKSTLAFDILFNEGQRRYLESLNAYARQFVQPSSRPDVDAIYGIAPTVAIEQRTSRGGRKSTVATLTETYHFLRLLFVKLGTQYCPDCLLPIEPQSADQILAQVMKQWKGKTLQLLAPLIVGRKGYYTDLAKWAEKKGFEALRVDGKMLPVKPWPRLDRYREHWIELPVGEIRVSAAKEQAVRDLIDAALEYGNGVLKLASPDKPDQLLSSRRACPGCQRSFEELDPRLFSFNSAHGWCRTCFGTGLRLKGFDEEQTGEEKYWTDWWDGEDRACVACDGDRLRPEGRAVRFMDHSIGEITRLSVSDALVWFKSLRLAGREARISRDLLAELRSRLQFLDEVGLSYLTLDRASPTLSGGEAQRIRLAAQLGSNLRGVCYILDEPTIGLHARDNKLLLRTLNKLKKKGNTVIVVEHDEETIRRADHVLDLGPGAGVLGGELVAQGTLKELLANPASVTGRCLRQPMRHPVNGRRRAVDGDGSEVNWLRVKAASLHNLNSIDINLPLGRLVSVTGVSGSGKSSLAREILLDNLLPRMGRSGRGRSPAWVGCGAIDGWKGIERVLEVDQTPIGKTPRSCPATYVGIWDHIRRLYAQTPEARLRAYTAGRFSFNTRGGRCEACEGQGVQKMEMSFLPDVRVGCDFCGGSRFDRETLSVQFKGCSIADILAMSIKEAAEFFSFDKRIHHALTLLQAVGLDYLTLGQQSPSLSGGEAQRIKLVAELARVNPHFVRRNNASKAGGTLYLLDEPTVGLHMADVEKLIGVLHRLVDAGNSVVVIEHNLDIIAEADWVIDLGPEGGAGGGRVVAEGPPEAIVMARKTSWTGRSLASTLKPRR